MRSLVILVTTTVLVSGRRDVAPGFAVNFRSFSDSPIYLKQHLPNRQQARSFRDASPISPQHQLQSFREDSYGIYRQPFTGREETRVFRDEGRPGFKEEPRIYKDEPRGTSGFQTNNREAFNHELRNFNQEPGPFRDEIRMFKDENRGFREETRPFREERFFRDEHQSNGEGPRHFREERPYKDHQRPFRDEIRPNRDEQRRFRDEARPFRDDARQFEEPRTFRDELRPFRDDQRPFKDERLFNDELRPSKDERPFRDDSGPYRSEFRPFRDESQSFRDDSRPYRDELRPFKDELLFTQESQSLAEAQHRFNKEQQQHRQPLSFGGHSNYLKYGNHGLGFASVPAALLPLEDNSEMTSGVMSEMSTTSATASPSFRQSDVQVTASPSGNADPKSQSAVTLAPDVLSTSSSFESANTIDSNGHRNIPTKNENLANGISTSPASTAVTISTSGGTDVTPKVVFGSESASMTSTTMGIGSAADSTNIHPANSPSANSIHATKSGIQMVSAPSSYFPSETSAEVPAALLNYVFKYHIPEETKTKYTFRQTLAPESYNHIQTVPVVHHQATKYAFLPDFKIPGLPTIRQSGRTINYVSAAELPKVPYLTANSAPITLDSSYSGANIPSVNYAQNFFQVEKENSFPHHEQNGQLTQLRQQLNQPEQYSQLRQLTSTGQWNQLGQYGQFSHPEQTRNTPFNQGGLQLQLGGFGGIDYSALSSNSEVSQPVPLRIAKVGLSLPEPPRPPAPTFAKPALRSWCIGK